MQLNILKKYFVFLFLILMPLMVHAQPSVEICLSHLFLNSLGRIRLPVGMSSYCFVVAFNEFTVCSAHVL